MSELEQYYNEVFSGPDDPEWDELEDQQKKKIEGLSDFAFWRLGKVARSLSVSTKEACENVVKAFKTMEK